MRLLPKHFTYEFICGLITGIGLGIILARWLAYEGLSIDNPLLIIACFWCIAIGGLLARRAQKKNRSTQSSLSDPFGR
ncbi:MAG: hypothetical protein CMJ19_04270 [Phycisphaeraceae bacterium]|nr:hypothetical protein [Phycisphaeraceae bacterium]